MTMQEAVAKLAELTKGAQAKLSEAEALADEHGLEFSFNPAYGMGGHYYGKGNEDWTESDAEEDGDANAGYWMSSSRGC